MSFQLLTFTMIMKMATVKLKIIPCMKMITCMEAFHPFQYSPWSMMGTSTMLYILNMASVRVSQVTTLLHQCMHLDRQYGDLSNMVLSYSCE